MVSIPFAPFEPDKNRFNAGALPEILNVLPVADGYQPLPGLSELTPAFEYLVDENGAILQDELPHDLGTGPDGIALNGYIQLPETCLGSIYVRTASGATRAFFGTETALFEYNFTDYLFVDISGDSAPYATPINARWSFVKFGDSVYCQNGNDVEQMIDIETGDFFEDNDTASRAYYLAVVGDFLVRARLVANPSKLQWSALNDPTSNVAGEGGSDDQLLADGNEITGIVPMSFGAVIFCRDAIHQMNFALSTEFIFTFGAITKYRGAVSPYAISQLGQDDFVFYSQDGWFRGVGMQPIGAERVDRWFVSQSSQGSRIAMVAAPDYRRKTVWFRYQNLANDYLLIGYQWQLDRWTHSDAGLVDALKLESPGITIDGLDALYSTIDDIDLPYDSSSFDGGSPEFGGVDQYGLLAFMNGAPLQATLTTNELAINGTSRSMANRAWLDGDATDFSVTQLTTNFKGDEFRERTPVSPSARTKSVPIRGDGRTHKFKIVIPEGADWTIATSMDVEAAGSGRL